MTGPTCDHCKKDTAGSNDIIVLCDDCASELKDLINQIRGENYKCSLRLIYETDCPECTSVVKDMMNIKTKKVMFVRSKDNSWHLERV